MNAAGSAVSRAPVFWLTLLGATPKHSNECSYPSQKMHPVTLLFPCYTSWPAHFHRKKFSIFRRQKGNQTLWAVLEEQVCSALPACSGPMGQLPLLWITEGSCYINLILTIQEQCMKELVWKSSAAVTRLIWLFKVSYNVKSESGPSIP